MTRDMADAHATARARDARAAVAFYDEGGEQADHSDCAWCIAMNDYIDATYPDQESDMPKKTATATVHVRLDPEHVALLEEIRDRLTERVTECGNVWRGLEGAPCVMPAGHDGHHHDAGTLAWANSPTLRPATDPDRKRVGLPVREPADEDPSCDDVQPGGGYFCTRSAGHAGDHGWEEEDIYWPATEPAPVDDGDPDEALAKVIQAAHFDRRDWLYTARAVREHIEAEASREGGASDA